MFTQDITLDPSYYERGVAARRTAHEDLHDVTDILDDIEDRADTLLAELLALLDDTVTEEVGQS
ncbi:hypothetical protein LZP97_26470 (plasmid) [Rhodococcus sp. DMF-1]|uniref:hypothetical protein n=1 Tax=Rhodococcus sp. DMF-1 TaxID=2907624 RepID=UPI001F17B74C|nr:hypothetical protein [Rhodococcus sp. DMF-1]UIR39642.1 hypothetical protein LZP97_26470 [Rhodococcus sp. DMF-1]